eukprot:Awhi_evm1s4319
MTPWRLLYRPAGCGKDERFREIHKYFENLDSQSNSKLGDAGITKYLMTFINLRVKRNVEKPNFNVSDLQTNW